MNAYVTTPIYYVNDVPHLGTAYTTVVADVIRRFRALDGAATFLLTGVDEHGQKVEQAAAARGVTPQAHVDELAPRFEEVARGLGVEPDHFMRTTAPFHARVVSDTLDLLFRKGDIYAADYEGWYSVSEEIFYTEKDLVDGKSPLGKPVQRVTERNYFFRMSAYRERLLEHIESHPKWITPDGKRSEVLGFLRGPLEDLCISRPRARTKWGIPLPFDRDFVTYVWFDALLNYVSALGYGRGREGVDFDEWWCGETVHVIGKDILVPHAVYWPVMLFALGLPLPASLVVHGWLLNESGGKMSKSEGDVIAPLVLRDTVGADPLRYYLCRGVPLGNDAPVSEKAVRTLVDADLANNLGNLLSRSTNLVSRYFSGKVPAAGRSFPGTAELAGHASRTVREVRRRAADFQPHAAAAEVVDLLSAANRYTERVAPWKTAKTDPALAGECLRQVLEVLRVAGILLSPIMPVKTAELLRVLGYRGPVSFAAAGAEEGLSTGGPVEKAEPLFPRLDKE